MRQAEQRWRMFLLLLAGFTFASNLLELLLQDHTGEPLQYVPLAACVLGFVAVALVLVKPARWSILIMRLSMVFIGLAGAIGSFIHLTRNLSFEQEIRPLATLSDTLLAALKGAAPLLAPGVLVFAALVALIATYRYGQASNP